MRQRFYLMMVALVTMVMTVWAYEPSIIEIDALKDAMVALNRDQYPNPDLVMPGDLVKVPADNPNTPGIESDLYMIYAVSPQDTINGRANCFWRVAERHLQSKNPVRVVNRTLESAQAAPDKVMTLEEDFDKESSKKANRDWFPWLAILTALVLLLWWLIGRSGNKERVEEQRRQREEETERQENPANYPPVMPSPMSNDPQAAAGQMQHFYGIRPLRMERGFFRRNADAQEYVLTTMAFGGGLQQPGRIYSEQGQRRGDRLYRCTMPGDEIRYALMACGNMTEALTIPQGWEWAVEAVADTAVQTTSVAIAKSSHQEPETVPPTPDGDKEKTVSITINPDGGTKLTITATGNQSAMPTKVEHGKEQTIIFFPKREG